MKKGVGNYTLAIDWTYADQYTVDATMNPETAYSSTDVRVYELVEIITAGKRTSIHCQQEDITVKFTTVSAS